jgi:hypothetical protein
MKALTYRITCSLVLLCPKLLQLLMAVPVFQVFCGETRPVTNVARENWYVQARLILFYCIQLILMTCTHASPEMVHPLLTYAEQACSNCFSIHSDAQKPCGTCKRSHRNALALADPGAPVPSIPECSYDEVTSSMASASTRADPTNTSKTRVERLEERLGMKTQLSMLTSLTRQRGPREIDSREGSADDAHAQPISGR